MAKIKLKWINKIEWSRKIWKRNIFQHIHKWRPDAVTRLLSIRFHIQRSHPIQLKCTIAKFQLFACVICSLSLHTLSMQPHYYMTYALCLEYWTEWAICRFYLLFAKVHFISKIIFIFYVCNIKWINTYLPVPNILLIIDLNRTHGIIQVKSHQKLLFGGTCKRILWRFCWKMECLWSSSFVFSLYNRNAKRKPTTHFCMITNSK